MTTSNRTDTGGRLALEWTRLRTRAASCTVATRWGIVDGPVESLDQILAAIGYDRPPNDADDARLRQLVLIAAHDDLAARVVIQRLLPGLLALVRRRQRPGNQAFDELVGAAWIAVRTFNTRRRPRSMAASLVSDADYAAFRAVARRRSSLEQPGEVAMDDRPARDEPSACEQLADLLTEAADAGVPETDIRLIRQLLGAPTATELAAVLQITPRTIRNRRDRITTRLREVAMVA